MDDKWFKARQKKAGVTADQIAARIGRDRSVVSKILNGHQPMSLEWAKAFASALDTPLDVVLEKAGVTDKKTARHFAPGFADSDAIAWVAQGAEDRGVPATAASLGQRPGIDVWTVRTSALSLMGYMPGDYILVDTNAADRARQGDAVIAQIYDNSAGSATTVLRRFEPPVLVAASMEPDERRVHVVDGTNVIIRGKVVASWRT